MKVPANVPADRLILDYLSRVTDASNRYLAKGKRIAFVGSTRRRIEREIGAAGMADPARVKEVLARFGDPEDLVKAERARQDEERVRRLSRKQETGSDDDAALTTPLQFRSLNSRRNPIAQPRPLRQQPDRAGPAAGQGGTGQQEPPAARPGETGEGKRKSRFGGLLLGRQNRPGAQPATPGDAGTQAPGGTVPLTPRGTGTLASGGAAAGGAAAGGAAAGGAAVSGAGTQAPGERRALPPGGPETPPSAAGLGETGTQAPGGISPRALSSGRSESGPEPSAGRVTPITAGAARAGSSGAGSAGAGSAEAGTAGAGTTEAGSAASAGHGTTAGDTSRLSRGGATLREVTATLGRGAGRLALGAARMARRSPLETIAILLLGVGGFLYPFPFWLLGGLLALWSRTWNAQDKWIALAGPLAIAFVGTLVTALIIGGLSHAVPMYPHAFRVSVGYLLRAGCVICAVYLAMQARRGPQRRLPPWKR